jgi:coenzyme F420-reducing hydrogenase delta subunit
VASHGGFYKDFAKAKVALDLLDRGAEVVSITGTDIKVVRKSQIDHAHQLPMGNNIVININANATASSSVNISTQFSIVKEELRRTYETSAEWSQLKEKIDQLEKEVKKLSPSESSLKEKLCWLLDFGWDVFAKIAPIVLNNVRIPT